MTANEVRTYSKAHYNIVIAPDGRLMMPNGKRSNLSMLVKDRRIYIRDLNDNKKNVFSCGRLELIDQFFEKQWFLNRIY